MPDPSGVDPGGSVQCHVPPTGLHISGGMGIPSGHLLEGSLSKRLVHSRSFVEVLLDLFPWRLIKQIFPLASFDVF